MSVRAVRGWGLVAALLLLSACAGTPAAQISSRPGALLADEVIIEESPATTPTSAAVTTTVAAATQPTQPPPPGLGVGATGALVLSLEQKLSNLHYYVGQVDEGYDGDTRDAVMAFQKVTGMDRTGRATDDVIAAITSTNTPPKPMVPAGGFKRVEIDLDRQVLFLYDTNNLSTILNVSTGNNERFCSEGWCRRAVTPPGSFVLYDQRSGWERSPLGWLYNSQYFNGGIAIHGSTSVPGYPASHGCVRISMSAAEWFPERVSVGTPVYVVSGEEPNPTPIGLNAPVTSTPTTIVPDTGRTPAPTTTAPPNLLQQLLFPSTTKKP